MDDKQWNFYASHHDMDRLQHSVIDSAFSAGAPDLTSCTGWGYGYPQAMLPVLSLTTTQSRLYDARKPSGAPAQTTPATGPSATTKETQSRDGPPSTQPQVTAIIIPSDTAVIPIGGSRYTYRTGDGTLVIHGTTLTAGGPAKVIDNQLLSLGRTVFYIMPTATAGGDSVRPGERLSGVANTQANGPLGTAAVQTNIPPILGGPIVTTITATAPDKSDPTPSIKGHPLKGSASRNTGITRAYIMGILIALGVQIFWGTHCTIF